MSALERRTRSAVELAALLGGVTFAIALGGAGAVPLGLVLLVGAVFSIVIAVRRRRPLLGSAGESIVAAISSLSLPPALFSELHTQAALAIFLLFAQAAKLAGPRTARDERIILLVSGIHAAVAASESANMVLAPFLFAHVTACCFALALQQLRACAIARAESGDAAALELRPGAAWFARIQLCAFATVAFSVFLFPLMPRVGARLAPRPRESLQRLSGFADMIDLEQAGRINESDELAFRAVVIERGLLPAIPFWRGRALDGYDGAKWFTSTMGRNEVIHQSYGTGERGLVYSFIDFRAALEPRTPRTEVELHVEPTRTWTLFTVANPAQATFRSRPPTLIGLSVLGNLTTFESRSNGAIYHLVAYPGQPLTRFTRRLQGRWDDYSQVCLELPPQVDAARIRAFALSVLARARLGEGSPAASKARALEDHLGQKPYRYTLDARRTPGVEPVADFLFGTREGHCERFASALAVMLRTVGVPSRVVTGYKGGEYRVWSQSYNVTQRQAHAWVEALTSDTGWETYDPTPADESENTRLSAVTQTLGEARDWLEIRWLKHVVTYDAADQLSILQRARDWFGSPIAEGTTRERRALAGLALAVALIGAQLFLARLGGLRAARWLLGRFAALLRGERAEPVAGPPASEALDEVLRALARRGVERRPTWTAADLATEAVARLGPVAAPLVDLVPLYYEARFGDRPLDPATRARFEEVARALAARSD